MRKILLATLLLAVVPVAAPAQVQVQIQIPLPVAPPLVAIRPGVEVVEGFGDEVFFQGGWFWLRRGPAWYRSREPRVAFVAVQPRYVPVYLRQLPPGRYRMYRAEERAERREWHARERHERRMEKIERKEWREREREGRKEWRERQREERKDWGEREREDRRDGGRRHPVPAGEDRGEGGHGRGHDRD